MGTLTPPSHVPPLPPRSGTFSEPTYASSGSRTYLRLSSYLGVKGEGEGEGEGKGWW